MTSRESANNQDPSLYCAYFGGPRDGLRSGDLPAVLSGQKLTGMVSKTPLSQPHQYSLYAVYECTSETQVDGFWVFEYRGMEGPNGEKLVAVDAEDHEAQAPGQTSHANVGHLGPAAAFRVGVDYALLLDRAFGEPWWASGHPDAIAFGTRWTIHVDGEAPTREALLDLAAAEQFPGYFFCGGRVLVDRFYDGSDCDLYITGADSSTRVRDDLTEIIRLGSAEFADWKSVSQLISPRTHS